ncbi:MAG: MMPL family transporter [Nannocystaceae bacterium]
MHVFQDRLALGRCLAASTALLTAGLCGIVDTITRSRARAAWALVAGLLLGWMALGQGSNIRLNTDLKALLPQDAASVVALRQVSKRRGPTDLLTLAVESEDPDATRRFSADLAERVSRWPELQELRAQRDYTPLRDHALYYLELEALEELRDTLKTEQRRALGNAMRLGISDHEISVEALMADDDWDVGLDDDDDDDGSEQGEQADAGDREKAADDPLFPDAAAGVADPPDRAAPLRDWLADRRESFVQDGRLSEREVDLIWPAEDENGALIFPDRVVQYRTSPDGRVQVIQAQLSRPATDLAFSRDVAARVDAAIVSLQPRRYHPSLRAMLVGSYEVSGEVNAVLADLKRATWLSALLVVVVLAGAFRTWRAVIIVLAPLGLAMLLTLALAELVYGELNSLTAFLFAVLFGMGVDFAVHLYAHRERDPDGTWSALLRRQLRPLVSTMLTTVGSLWVLSLADFKGFQEFGVISGAGVGLCLVSALVFVPVLDVLLGRPRWRRAARKVAMPDSIPRMRRTVARRIVALRIAVLVGLGAVVGWGLPHVTFENNLRALRAPSGPQKERRIPYGSALGDKRTSVPLVLTADSDADLDTAVARFREVAGAPDPDFSDPDGSPRTWIKDALSARTTLPEDPVAKQPILREIRALALDFASDLAPLASDDPAKRYATHLDVLAKLAGAVPLTLDDMPAWTTRPFAQADGRLGRIGHVYLRFRQHDLAEVRWVVGRVRAQLDDLDVVAASSSFVYADLSEALEGDAARLPPFALAMILCMIAADLRRVRQTLRCFSALLLGLGLTLAIMGLCDVHINFYNFVVMPAVVGLGIDASLHLWHATQRGHIAATSKATIVAACTTIGAFGGLLATAHPGLRSIGEVGVLAIACSVLAAFLVLVVGRGSPASGSAGDS